jgi:DNA replication protein DnaC
MKEQILKMIREQEQKNIDATYRRLINQILAKLPKRYRSVTPSLKFPNEEGVFITGTSGAGKTHTACRLFYKRCLDLGTVQECLFFTVPELMESLRKEYDKMDPDVPRDLLDRCKKSPLLVLDDLGTEKLTDWASERLGMIINYRYNEMKTTIVTSNLSIEEIEANVSQRISSRFRVMHFIQVEGSDKRIQV